MFQGFAQGNLLQEIWLPRSPQLHRQPGNGNHIKSLTYSALKIDLHWIGVELTELHLRKVTTVALNCKLRIRCEMLVLKPSKLLLSNI